MPSRDRAFNPRGAGRVGAGPEREGACYTHLLVEGREDEGAGAAFDAELLRMAEAASDAFAVERRGAGSLVLHARAPDGFDVDVQRAAHAVEIRIGPWLHREVWAEDDDAAEGLEAALDLVAAAMWGRIVLHETTAGGRPWRFRVRFQAEAASREVASGGGGLLGWRPGAITRERRNHARPPHGTVMKEGGALPTRPWIGVREHDDARDPAALPLDGELDLHPFSPKEVAPLVREYIAACRERGVLHLRIVHGKGKGQLRRTVHSILERHDAVASFRLGGHGEGSWGATMVELHPPAD
jgi:hypothetical protein